MKDKTNTTKANIFRKDNDTLKKWALEASAKEGKILYTSEMIRRVIRLSRYQRTEPKVNP